MSAMPAIFNGATAASEMTELRNRSIWSQFVYRCCCTLMQMTSAKFEREQTLLEELKRMAKACIWSPGKLA